MSAVRPRQSPLRQAPDEPHGLRTFPLAIPYAYTLDAPACVKSKLPAVAGAGKALATLSCN